MRIGFCRGCGQPILWIKTTGGKSLPCDPDPLTYREAAKGRERIVTPNGEVLACEIESDTSKATGIGYKAHWSTCPKADDFRRRKGGGPRESAAGRL